MAKSKKKTNVKVRLPEVDNKNAKRVKLTGIKTFAEENKHWYDLPTEQVAGAVKQMIIQIGNNNEDQQRMFEVYANMYGSYDTQDSTLLDAVSTDMSTNIPTYNIIQSISDTLISKLVRDNPKPVFITSGADYFTKLKAEKQTQFVQGIFQETNFYDIMDNQVLRDSVVLGTGGIKWKITKDNKLKCEWIFMDDVKIDRVDSFKKTPRNQFFCSLMHKEQILEEYPDSAEEVMHLAGQRPEYFQSRQTVIEFMVINEAFHLKTTDKPGRHVVCVEDIVLLDEEWDEDWFPQLFNPLYNKPTGIMGRGVAETLYSSQIEINKQLLMIQQCEELQSAPLILVPNGSQISADVLLSNNIARMVPYNAQGGEPKFLSPESVSQQIYEWLKWRITASYQEFGISLTSAGGTKQPGVDSAIAMRTMVDIENTRFIQISKNWEKFVVDNAYIVMKLAKRAYEKNGKEKDKKKDFTVRYVDKKSKIIKDIPWSKIAVEGDNFVIQCDTTSSFPQSYAGRVSTIMEMFSSGIFSQPRTLEMLGMDPDIDDEYRKQTASLRLCEKMLSLMVEEEEPVYNHPEKYMDLNLALKTSVMVYEQLKIDECPEDRLQLVRQWIGEIATLTGTPNPLIAQLQSLYQPPAQAKQAPQGGLQSNSVQPQQQVQ